MISDSVRATDQCGQWMEWITYFYEEFKIPVPIFAKMHEVRNLNLVHWLEVPETEKADLTQIEFAEGKSVRLNNDLAITFADLSRIQCGNLE